MIELLDYLEVGHRRAPFLAKLSGGEAQRMAIPRTLANRPRIILANEPTAALDSNRAGTVMDLLRKLVIMQNAAVIAVTHDDKSFDRFDRILTYAMGCSWTKRRFAASRATSFAPGHHAKPAISLDASFVPYKQGIDIPGVSRRRRRSMKTRAAVAWKAGQRLSIETVDLEGPKTGEVLIEIKATGVCHTDAHTLSGDDKGHLLGLFPCILGHEGAGIVREVGPDVRTLKVGDHVIPLYVPECRS